MPVVSPRYHTSASAGTPGSTRAVGVGSAIIAVLVLLLFGLVFLVLLVLVVDTLLVDEVVEGAACGDEVTSLLIASLSAEAPRRVIRITISTAFVRYGLSNLCY